MQRSEAENSDQIQKEGDDKSKKESAILTNLIINLQEGILLENAKREIVLTNQLFCDMFAIPAPPEVLTGADCSESAEQSKHLFKDPEKFVFDINLILKNKVAIYQDELELADGRYFERDYIPTYSDDKYSGHLWRYRDITERKRSEESLTKLSKAIEQSPVITCITDLKGDIEYVNPKVLKITGYTKEELIGQNPRIFSSINNTAEDYAFLWQSISSGKEWKGEFHNKKKNGDLYWVAASISPVTDIHGKITHYLAVEEDITERKQSEEEKIKLNASLELKVKERTIQLAEINSNLTKEIKEHVSTGTALNEALGRLHKIADRVPGMVYQYLLRPDGTSCFPYASDGISEIYRTTPDKVSYDASIVFTRLHPDDFDGVVASIQASAKDLTLWKHDYRVKFDDGIIRWVSGNAKPQRETDGTILWHGFLTDITERKQAEEKINEARKDAEKANLAKSEFLSRMSHELRTPMNSILGFAQLLGMGELTVKQKKGVNHILGSGRHLLTLIDEVLDISRIEAGKLSLLTEPVYLNGVINEMIDTVRPLALAQQLTLEFENSLENQHFVAADRKRLKQVLINLLNNAVKYNRQGGSIRIVTTTIPQNEVGIVYVRISISDTGYGISSADIPKLFIPFERIGAENTSTEGAGLGLSIVKKLIDVMHGLVGVDSIEGQGSTFWIDLPLTKPLIPKDQKENINLLNVEKNAISPDKQEIVKTLTILYFEDNLENTELVEEIIENHFSEVQLITSIYGKNAEEMAIECKPDLILLDLDLPDTQGISVLKKLQENENTKTIPVVIISADATNKQIETLMNAGACDYLTKPLDITMFLKTVDDWIPKPVNNPKL